MFKTLRSRLIVSVVPILVSAVIVGVAARNYATEADSGWRFNLGVDLAGGTILVYEADEKWWNDLSQQDRDKFDSANLAAALKRRIDPNNLMEITIRPVDIKPPRIEIILPIRSSVSNPQGAEGIERVKSIVRQVGKLEFRILANTKDDENAIDEAKSLVQGEPDLNALGAPEGYEWLELDAKEASDRKTRAQEGKETLSEGFQLHDTSATVSEGNVRYGIAFYNAIKADRYFVLTRIPAPEATVTGEDLGSARPDFDRGWRVLFTVKPGGADRMDGLTRPAVGRYMATVMDKKVMSYAVIQSPLRDNIQVTMGSGAAREVKQKVDELVLILRSGALPATLKPKPVSELTMGPGLGQDTIDKGTRAVIFAFLAVVVFMVGYYRLSGGIASIALFANLLLTVAFMVWVNATFTLPGLAGLVLMLGMAVDANVLIYERIREERERGSVLALAIRNGYDRAFPTIIDTHLTSIFTAIVLYVVGNDQLKGFGVSLAAGLIISLFTSLFMTRLLFDIFLVRGWVRQLKMMKLLAKPNIDFMGVRYYWFTATAVLSIFVGSPGTELEFAL